MVQWFDNNPSGQIADFSQLGALGKIGLVLSNIADPNTLPQYQQALANQTQQNIINQTRQNELDKQSKLAALAADPSFQNLDINGKYGALAAIDPAYAAKQLDYQASQQLTPYQRASLAQSGQASALANRRLQIELDQQRQLAALLGLSGQPQASVPQQGGMSTPNNIANFDAPQSNGASADALARYGVATGNSALVSYATALQERQRATENFGDYAPGQGGSTKTGTPFTIDESGKPIVGVLPVPGYVPATGSVPTADDTKKVKNALASYEKLNREGGLLDRYSQAVEKYGSELGGEGGTLLSGLKTDINLELKNINELGALAGPDQEILNAQLYDPTDISANIRGITPFATSPTTLAKQSIDRLKATTQSTLDSGLGVTGYKPLNGKSVVANLDGWSVKEKK